MSRWLPNPSVRRWLQLCAPDDALAGEWQAAYTWAKQAIEQRSRSLDFHAGFAFDHLIAALFQQGEVDTAPASK